MTPSPFTSPAIACLRAPYDPAAAEQARADLSDPAFDWAGFVAYLHAQRISPLVHHHLAGGGLLPPEASASLRRAYLQTALVNSLRLEELDHLLDRFAAAGIPVTLLKGAAFLYTLCEKSALRPMSDIDLLVRAADVEKARQVLAAHGYSLAIAGSIPTEFETEIAFQKPGPHPWLVELHSNLLTPQHRLSTGQMDWFLERRAATLKGSQTVWAFSAEAQLLHLAAHLWLHHGGGDLLGWHDIYQVIRQNQERIDWEQVLAVAETFDLLMPLQNVLPELAARWQSPVPGEILARLSQMKPSRRETLKFGKFWGDDQNYADTLLAGVLSYPDWRSRLSFAWIIVFPPAEYIRERYQVRSPLLLPYFYAYRLATRAFQQLRRVLHSGAV